MATPPVRVAITAEDLTGSAFSSAAAKTQAFQSATIATSGSMKEAKGAAMLLGEEIGVKMNRHLVSAMTSSTLLRGALSAAFPVVAAIGFIEIIQRIPDAIKKATDFFGGFTQASKDAMEEAVKSNEKVYSSFKKIAQGYELLATLHKVQADAAANAPKDSAMNGPDMQSTALGFLGPPGALVGWALQRYNVQSQINSASAQDLKVQGQIRAVLEQMNRLFEDRNKKEEKSIENAEKLLARIRQRVADEIHNGVGLLPDPAASWMNKEKLSGDFSAPDWMAQLSNAQTNPLYSGSDAAMRMAKIQSDQTAAIQAAQEVYAQTRTKAQEYSDAIAGLTELLNQGRISQAQFSAAAGQAASKLSETNKYAQEFGREVGQTMNQAMLFGRSWSDAFKTILADLIKLILQMYVFKTLSQSFGGAKGGFMGSFFNGLAGGKASGGPVSSGMSYLVGENGPEIFTPGASGAITPNGALGGQTVNHFDMRGSIVTSEVVTKAELAGAMKATESRAISRSVNAVQERDLRRPYSR